MHNERQIFQNARTLHHLLKFKPDNSICLLRTNRQPINTWTLVPALCSFEDTTLLGAVK